MALRKSPVHAFAEQAGLPLLTPAQPQEPRESRSASRRFDADVGGGRGLWADPAEAAILEGSRHGALNLHASLLPRWRGAAPINRAIMAGDTETGVSIMRIDEGLDAGPVCLDERMPIGPDMTAGELHDALAAMGAALMVEALAGLERGSLDCRPQPDEGVTYAAKIDPAETRIDWSLPAREVHNLIRGLSPHPGAWFEIEAQRQARAHPRAPRDACRWRRASPARCSTIGLTIACGEGAVRLTEVQRAGKRPMSADDFLRGVPFARYGFALAVTVIAGLDPPTRAEALSPARQPSLRRAKARQPIPLALHRVER